MRHIHKRSPGILISSNVAKLSALKGLFLVKAAGLGGAAVIGKKKAKAKTYKAVKTVKTIQSGSGLWAFRVRTPRRVRSAAEIELMTLRPSRRRFLHLLVHCAFQSDLVYQGNCPGDHYGE